MAQILTIKAIEKPWGRTDLPEAFAGLPDGKIGEVWYEGCKDQDLPLLMKYIFTSERLSIQVHPNDVEAQAKGLPHGKEEAWYILDCEPGARLGIGLLHPLTAEEFRVAALDGSLEDLIDWKPVKPGDCYFIPAGTVHAIGAGITLVEVQQNVDITYRLYDYGRPRRLHLDEGLAVSSLLSYACPLIEAPLGRDRALVSSCDAPFWLELAAWEAGRDIIAPSGGPTWFTPLRGAGRVDDQPWRTGECWLVNAGNRITVEVDACALLAGEAATAWQG